MRIKSSSGSKSPCLKIDSFEPYQVIPIIESFKLKVGTYMGTYNKGRKFNRNNVGYRYIGRVSSKSLDRGQWR